MAGVAAATVLAACGGDDGGGGASPGSTDYASCLRANGVTLPSGRPGGLPSGALPSGRPSGRPTGGFDGTPPSGRPGGGPSGRPGGGNGFGGPGSFGSEAPDGVDQATWEKAQKACQGLRPSGAPARSDNGALTAYRTCLSDRGITVNGGLDNLDANDPKVAAAMAACAALRPSGRSPSPSG
ncbi:hypothetical protein Voc01_049860 [Virgisporangium ochraceum]|uniref:Uncharacterized protein n=1 Tax=Virgisporangium ochraceum TaxID=65505 RepID=A0A8J3ZT91_9ACTN|nr:hypothetical protein Voc01_049860 [Virgisporangium ochraceum]